MFPTRKRLAEIVVNVTRMFSRVAATAIIVGTVVALFGGAGHWFDLFTHFPHVYLTAGALFVVLLAMTGARRHAALLAVFAVINVMHLGAWLPRPSVQPCHASDKIVVINALATNERHDLVETYVEGERPEVLVVSELMPGLHRRLKPHFRHTTYAPGTHSGVGVYSRYPLEDERAFGSPLYDIPQLEVTLRTDDGPVRLIAAHPIAPFHPAATRDRNATLAQFVEITRESDLPVVLAGDLNVSMFSPEYTPLADAGLRNAREGRGVMPTFPVHLPVRVPIDHVMHTDDVTVCDFSVGQDINSDHFPVVATIDWPDEARPTAVADLAAVR